MIEQISERERQRTLKLAEEYRGEGYEVVVSPTSEQLPDFLSGYHPDLLVKKGNEALIVEVKTRTSLDENHSGPRFSALTSSPARLEV